MGRVPDQMVKAIRSFLEFCYLVRRSVLDENDLDQLDELLADFHKEREIFRELGIRSDFNLPRQHSMTHYCELVIKFGAPNGLCSSITESKHIQAVKKPWRRSSKFNALSQMLRTNQRIDNLAASTVDFQARGMLKESIWANYVDPPPPPQVGGPGQLPNDDDDGDGVDDRDILGEVNLAKEPSTSLYFCFHQSKWAWQFVISPVLLRYLHSG